MNVMYISENFQKKKVKPSKMFSRESINNIHPHPIVYDETKYQTVLFTSRIGLMGCKRFEFSERIESRLIGYSKCASCDQETDLSELYHPITVNDGNFDPPSTGWVCTTCIRNFYGTGHTFMGYGMTSRQLMKEEQVIAQLPTLEKGLSCKDIIDYMRQIIIANQWHAEDNARTGSFTKERAEELAKSCDDKIYSSAAIMLRPRFLAKKVKKQWKKYCSIQKFKKEKAVKRIQKSWKRCRDDPGFAVCRKRLKQEYEELCE